MSDEWTGWIFHDDSGRPPNVHNEAIVIVDLSGDVLSPMRAYEADWHCPRDPVTRYKIRKPRAQQQLIEMIKALPVEESQDA